MRPELVYVPSVFRHPDLPDETVSKSSFHHVDLLPTLLAVPDQDHDRTQFDGAAPPTAFDDDPRPCFWQNQFLPDRFPVITGELRYEGVWDSSGGHVRTDTPRLDRYGVLAGKLVRSSKRRYMWRHLRGCLSGYSWSARTFESPSFDTETATDVLERAKEDARTGRRTDLSSSETEHLRDLGYMN
jgi:hypothetical protein